MNGYRPGPVALLCALLVAVFLLMPLLAVVPVSFTPSRMLSMPTGALSLRHYRTLVDDPRWLDSILLSLRVGIVSSTLATLFALAFGLGIWMFRPRFTAALVGFVLLPMIVPPVVSAITLYFLLTSLSGIGGFAGYDTWPGVVLAHIVVTVPFAVVLILVALSQVDRRIDLAALSRSYLKEQIRFIEIAYGSLMEVYCQLLISLDLGYLKDDELDNAQQIIFLISNKLNALKNSILSRMKV